MHDLFFFSRYIIKTNPKTKEIFEVESEFKNTIIFRKNNLTPLEACEFYIDKKFIDKFVLNFK